MNWENPLTLSDMVEITRYAGLATAAELARRLGKEYFTVVKAVQRVRAGRMACPLSWTLCSECGEPIAGPRGRKAHASCEQARAVRKGRERRRGPHVTSTQYVARYRREQPEAARLLREREKAALRERWPDLPAKIKEEMLAKVHHADARDYPLTRERADMLGERWSEDDDLVVLERLKDPAREVALELGRTLWAVRHRRMRLRRNEDSGQGDLP